MRVIPHERLREYRLQSQLDQRARRHEADEQDYYNRDSKRDTLEAARLCFLALILSAIVAWVFG
jgi:hypothetical protein